MTTDLEHLEQLSSILHALGDEARSLRTGPAAGPYASTVGGTMSSVLEASSISADLVDGALVAALAERLGETGDVMRYVAAQYRNQETANAEQLVRTYLDATGDWDAPGDPA
ncbi:hypothetical protein J2X34_000545 [Rhodococcus sp. BE178]|nr:hypothetical protein [Rhodococcus sp. AG1013]